jgi:hypothetical protein
MLELLHLRRRAGMNAATGASSNNTGKSPRAFQLIDEGMHVPVFTFEKISPPVRRGPIAPIVKKQRGIIVQILDRFVEVRVKRTLRGEKGGIARRPHRPPD